MKQIKHNHKLTDLLKFFIFSLILLMPFMVFIPNAFYYGFNEQAIAQEKTEQIPVYYESNEVNNIADFIPGNVYYYTNNYVPSYSGDYTLTLFYIDIDFFKTQFPSYSNLNITSVEFDINRVNGNAFLYLNGSATSIQISSTPFYFVLKQINQSNNTILYGLPYIRYTDKLFIKEYQPITTNMSITDSMSYAWDSVWQNDLFSWVNNTSIFTVIDNMNTILGIATESCIAQYLTYIFLLTVIYIIVDIIIATFTYITHLFGKEGNI